MNIDNLSEKELDNCLLNAYIDDLYNNVSKKDMIYYILLNTNLIEFYVYLIIAKKTVIAKKV